MTDKQIFVAFDRVIKKVGPRDRPTKSNEELIIIGPGGRVVSKKPLFANAKNYNYYIVTTRNLVECSGFHYRLKEADTQRKIEFDVSYEISCPVSEAQTLATALSSPDHPQKVFNRFWGDWTRAFFRTKKKEHIDVIEEFYSILPELKKYVRDKAKEVCGIELDIFYVPKGQDSIKNYAIKSSEFDLRVKDFSDEMKVSFETELEVIEGRDMKAILKAQELTSVEGIFISEIKKWFLRHVSLQDYQFRLHSSLRNDLIDILNKVIEPLGRKIAYFHFSSFTELEPTESQVIEWEGKVRIKDYEKPIEVKSNLLLSLHDFGKYMNSNIVNLKNWADKELHKIIQRALFDKTYIDIIVKLDQLKAQIESEMKASAKQIGYSLQQLLVLPQIRALSLLDGFSIIIDQEFVTIDSGVSLQLKIIVRGRIKDLSPEPLKEYLNPRVDLERTIRASIKNEIEQAIYQIHPEQIYLFFRDANYDGDRSVEEILKDKIKGVLKRFYVSDMRITISPEENDIVRRLKNLVGKFRSLEFEIIPFNHAGNGETIPATLDFKIAGIDRGGWSVFMDNRFPDTEAELEKIKQVLQKDLIGKLQTVPAEALQYRDYETKIETEKHLIQSCIPVIIKNFGLVVQIVNYQRAPTEYERAEIDVLKKNRLISLESSSIAHEESEVEKRDRLQILYARRKNLLSEGIGKGDPVYDEISSEIDQMKEGMINKDPGRVHPRQIENREKKFSFEIFENNAAKQIEGNEEQESNPPSNSEEEITVEIDSES